MAVAWFASVDVARLAVGGLPTRARGEKINVRTIVGGRAIHAPKE